MQIELTAKGREVVEKLIDAGKFHSADEVVQHALEFYDSCQPTLESLRAKIQEGMDDIAAGRVSPLDVEDVKRRGRERLAAENLQ